MKKKTYLNIILGLTLLWLLLPQAKALAATYYLDIDGVGEDGILGTADDVISSDANPGTAEAPWKTLNRAYTWYSGSGPKVQEGDTVYFKNGSYGTFIESDQVSPAQHYHRTNWITYAAAPGHSPNLDSIYIHNKYNDIGQSYLIFDGFDIADGTTFDVTQYVQIKNCNITTMTSVPYNGVYTPYYLDHDCPVVSIGEVALPVAYITVEGCNLFGGGEGIYVRNGEHIVIRGNTIQNYGTDGIKYTTINDLLIENNTVYDSNSYHAAWAIYGTLSGTFEQGEAIVQDVTGAVGIFHSMDGGNTMMTYFRNNSKGFLAAPSGGTITGQSSGATLSSVYNSDTPGTDGIETHSICQTVTIRNNKLFIPSSAQGITLYGYGGATDYTIENNLVVGAAKVFVIAGGTVGIKINNNTGIGGYFRCQIEHGSLVIDELYNNVLTRFVQNSDSVGSTIRVVSHGNNIFGNNPDGQGGPAYPFDVNGTELVNYDINTLFVDAANGDFRLAKGSVAIDFGDPAYAPATDILGNPRDAQPDAGCYEYGASTFLYGDVSGNGEISAYDAALTAQYSVALIELTPDQIKAADVSGNEEVSAYDAALIAQKAVGLIEKFPVEG